MLVGNAKQYSPKEDSLVVSYKTNHSLPILFQQWHSQVFTQLIQSYTEMFIEYTKLQQMFIENLKSQIRRKQRCPLTGEWMKCGTFTEWSIK